LVHRMPEGFREAHPGQTDSAGRDAVHGSR
jgi:hypothetical protein